jgi:hypothetical protein
LAHEVESYNSASGAFVAWCKMHSITSASATTIHTGYGDATVTASLANAANVWDSNYKGVWHLGDSAANTTIAESTVNAKPLTNSVNTAVSASAGKIGGGINYVPNDFASNDSFTALQTASAATIEVWAKTSTNGQVGGSGYGAQLISIPTATGGNNGFDIRYEGTDTMGLSVVTSTGFAFPTYTVSYADGNWHKFVAVYNGSDVVFYVNGVAQGSPTTVTGVFAFASTQVNLARFGTFGNYAAATLDEARVSNIARSANWIATEYSNQSDPATFYTIGSEVVIGGGAVAPSAHWVSTTTNWIWFQ